MDTMARLDELLSRASKITDGQAKEAAMLLLSLYSETKDTARVADYLMKLKSTVCLSFFEGVVKTHDPESQIQSIHSAICSTEAYKKNANHAATSRGFIISAVLIKSEINIARAILMRTITDVEKDGKFTDAVVSNFKQYVLDYCGSLESIKALDDKLWNKSGDKNRFSRFMEAVSSSIVTVISPSKTESELAVTGMPIVPAISAPTTAIEEPQSVPIPASDAAMGLAEKLLEMLSSASNEATVLLQSLSDSNGIISLLRKDVANRDSRIAELSMELNEKDRIITELQRKLEESQQSVHEGEARTSDLSERLKTALQMDSISQNQELITLKTSIQNRLKIEHSDYLVSKDSECTPDNYRAAISTLSQIFKTLRGLGIIIE